MTEQKHDWQSYALLAFLGVVWGSSFILIKKGLVAFAPEQVGALRIFISFLALLPLAFSRLRYIPRKKFFPVFIVGLLGSGIPPFLFSFAQTEVDSAVAGIINSATPLFTLLIGVLFFSTRVTWMKITGVVLGIIGTIDLMLIKADGSLEMHYGYASLIILATICYAGSVNLMKAFLQEQPALNITVTAFMMLGPPAGIYLFSTGFVETLLTHPEAWASLGFVAILAVMGTALATFLFFGLVQRTNALFGSTVTYLIPVVAIGWGLLDGEAFGMWQLLGMVFILLGVYLSGRR